MKELYLDTNIFIYLSNSDSDFYGDCSEFIRFSQNEKFKLLTSTETFQEIIYFCQKSKQVDRGLKICGLINELVDEVLGVNEVTIEKFLKLVKDYPDVGARDLIHAASCIERGVGKMVTVDTDFKQIKEIQSYGPGEFSS